ncbi:MAG: 4Fe-4S binding protein [Anaerolineaceae bacterium]|nr:4Fe-4S binding protein [Anaerolineaceae bacterium]
MAEKKYKRGDSSILYGPQIVGAKVRELLKGKYEIIPKTKQHIKVNRIKCIGMTCQLCYISCPTGSFEMKEGKAIWDGMETCGECGTCRYVCPVNAIDWSYPEAGTGIVLKWS